MSNVSYICIHCIKVNKAKIFCQWWPELQHRILDLLRSRSRLEYRYPMCEAKIPYQCCLFWSRVKLDPFKNYSILFCRSWMKTMKWHIPQTQQTRSRSRSSLVIFKNLLDARLLGAMVTSHFNRSNQSQITISLVFI